MARKRLAEDPPPAVSSSEEEGEESGTEEEEEEHPNGTVPAQNGTSEKQNDDEDGSEDDEDKEDDEEEDDDDDDDDDEEEKEETEKPNQLLSIPSQPDSESDSNTESEKSGSTEPPSPSLSDFSIKTISPKQKRADGEVDGVNVAFKKKRTLVNGEGIEDFWEKYPHLRSLLSEVFPGDMKESAMLILGKVREEKLAELDRKGKSLMTVKLELFLKQRELVDEHLKLALDAMKSQEDS